MHDGHQIYALLMAFSKAFGKVIHGLLIKKLNHYGVCGCTNKWNEVFLTGRSQGVVLEGEFSVSTQVLSGVPQGLVVGPYLFLFYINDLPEFLVSNVRLFADDTIVYLPIHADSDCQVLQRDLDNLAVWEKIMENGIPPGQIQGSSYRA